MLVQLGFVMTCLQTLRIILECHKYGNNCVYRNMCKNSVVSPILSERIISRVRRGHRDSQNHFRHPPLSQQEFEQGCKLGIDSYADTSCAGKHSHVLEFNEGLTVSATGFAGSETMKIDDLWLANVAYAYDTPQGDTIILVVNNAIYLGEFMDGSLLNPIQCMEKGIQIDIRPKIFYPGVESAQTFAIPSLQRIFPIEYDGAVPFLHVRKPTSEEIHECTHVEITCRETWDPHAVNGLNICSSESNTSYNHTLDTYVSEMIDDHLMSFNIGQVMSDRQFRYPYDCEYSVNHLSSKKKYRVTPEELNRLWGVGLKTCERTLKATTHLAMRTTGALTKRFRTDKAQLRYKQLGTHFGLFSVDTVTAKVKSIRGFTCGNVYINRCGFKKFYGMYDFTSLSSRDTLVNFIQAVGIPAALHSDNHGNFTTGAFRQEVRKYGVKHTFTEPNSPWQNPAESGIREIKKLSKKWMARTNSPVRLWCFCFELAADVLSLCATMHYSLQGRTPYEITCNYTPDISEYVTFAWYDWVYYWDEHIREKKIGRWLGPAHKVGQSLCYYILNEDANYIARSSVVPIPAEEMTSDVLKLQMTDFTNRIESKIGNSKEAIFDPDLPCSIYDDNYDDPRNDEHLTEPFESEMMDYNVAIDEHTLESLDNYIGAQIIIPGENGATPILAKVVGRKRDISGAVIGKYNSNPILDTHIYKLQHPDGHVFEYTTNQIAESLYSQVDDDGYNEAILDEIIDHRRTEDAIPRDYGFTEDIRGHQKPIITTKGWEMQVRWKDGTLDWLPLSLVKEGNPVMCAEYALANDISKEPAFNWWVHTTLKKRDRIISKVQTRLRKKNMKFGIQIPRTVEEAYELDRINGNTLWADAIDKEFRNSSVAFQVRDEGEIAPVGWTKITCHLIFDVKMDLTRKARYVAGGHLTDVDPHYTYASVVGRDSVRIAFMLAALNGLNVLAGDIQNAYLNAPSLEKNYFIAGSEWGEYKGRIILIVRALYGQKTSGAAWRAYLANFLEKTLGYKESMADRDVWMKPKSKCNGDTYYSYIVCYCDDLLIIDEEPHKTMERIQDTFTVKPSSIGEPTIYLGAECGKVNYQNTDGTMRTVWTMSSSRYVKDAVKTVKDRLKESGYKFHKKLSDINYSPKQPFSSTSYAAELDTSKECTDDEASLFQNMIGILRWAIELGRIDIAYEVSILSRYLAVPRTGHLLQCIHIFKYLEIHCDNKLAFDHAKLNIGYAPGKSPEDIKQKMADYYKDAHDEIPPNMPEPRGKSVQINVFVDASHAGDKITRRSQTGILIYCNMAPIIWYSKKQNTIETSTFSSELVALRIASEMITSLRYKLRMFGVALDGPANVFCDNESVYKSVNNADSRLKKKHNSICYHKVRECVASGILIVMKEDTNTNLADILTKSLSGEKRIQMHRMIMVST